MNWYGIWAEDEQEFKLAQEILINKFGLKYGLRRGFNSYRGTKGVWVLCAEGRSSLAHSPYEKWDPDVIGGLTELPLRFTLENK